MQTRETRPSPLPALPPSPSQAAAAASTSRIHVSGFELHGATGFSDAEITAVLAGYVGRALTTAEIHAAAGGIGLPWVSVLAVIVAGLVLFVIGYRAPGTNAGPAPIVQATRLPLGALFSAAWIWAFYNAALAMVFSFGPIVLVSRAWALAAASSATSLYLVLLGMAMLVSCLASLSLFRRSAKLAAAPTAA